MAHFPNPWLNGPPTSSNFSCVNFNTNPGNIRSSLQSFQRNPTVPFHSFPVSSPPPISPGTFPGRPGFQNFSDLSSPAFRNRQSAFEGMPPPNIPPPNMPPSNMPPSSMPTMRPRFLAAGNFENRPTPWHQTDNFIRNRSPFTDRPRPPYQSKSRDFNKFKKNDRKFKRKDNRKFKDDTTEKPFYCDMCDRAYALENELQSHLMEHTKCDFAGCCFEAHPKIVALHKKMQHDTGYADVINKLQDSEEIKKWREERRKRFPTAENIKKRKAEQAEKEARGEVLETKDFGKFKRRKFDPANLRNKNVRNRGNRFHRSKTHQRRNEKFSQPVASKAMITISDSDSDSHITLPKFLGMSSVNASGHCNQNVDSLDLQSENVSEVEKLSCVDKEFLSDKSESCKVPPVNKVFQPLSNLSNEVKESDSLCQLNGGSNNGSDDLHVGKNVKSSCHIEAVNIESDDEPPTVLPILKTAVTGNSNSVDNPGTETLFPKSFNSDDEPPTVIPIIKSSIESPNSVDSVAEVPCSRLAAKGDTNQRHVEKVEGNINPKHFERNNKKVDPSGVPVRKSTLLEKLLADDIRHERNVILQCIRHIVKKNFFGIGSAVKWKSP